MGHNLNVCGSNSAVEFLPSKQGVAGSNPVSRSTMTTRTARPISGPRCGREDTLEITKHTPGMFSWADLATPDAEGSKAFYTEILGLTATDLPMQPGMVYSMLAKDGSNVCAIYQMPEEMGQMTGGQPVWNSYFTMESADETASRVAELGGAVMMGPVDVFDSGRMVVSSDPTGAVFSVWEPKSHTGAQVFGEPGALAWNELKTHDTEAAAQFYGGLFGWSANTTPSAGGGEYTEFRLDGVSAAGMMAIRKGVGRGSPQLDGLLCGRQPGRGVGHCEPPRGDRGDGAHGGPGRGPLRPAAGPAGGLRLRHPDRPGRVGASVLRDRGEGRGADHQERRVAERIPGPSAQTPVGVWNAPHQVTPLHYRHRFNLEQQVGVRHPGRPGFRW